MSKERAIIDAVSLWIENVVIGLELCPFARSVYDNQQIRYRVSRSEHVDELMFDLHQEISWLASQPETDTSLLIIPCQMDEFSEFNQMLDQAESLLDAYDWQGVFQLASFHPFYQFADCQPQDRQNWSNRAPYPILHILRESSVEQAIQHFPEIDEIPRKNIEKLNSMSEECFTKIFKSDV